MQIQSFAAQQIGTNLEPYPFTVNSPQDHDCLIRVQYCGICHSDIHMIDNDWGITQYPLIPGHEVIGIVEAVGAQVHHLKVGDRVGVGWQRSSCLSCLDCLRGNENLCNQNQGLIVSGAGGFANYLLTDARFAFLIPPEIESPIAGPLLCGGITVYSGLRYAGMTSGQEIGIIGIGGLGHMAVQFAKRLGNRVTVFTTSEDKAALAQELGADTAIIVPKGSSAPKPTQFLDILLSTVPTSLDWASYIDYLNSDGTFNLVGVPDAPLTIPLFLLMMKRRRILSSPIGGRAMIQEMLSAAAKFQIKPKVEIFPIQHINEAIERVRSNQVRYRAVLDMSSW
jgi:uncharacterized zinc-type alcohol dehydrogenase-like protein